jgi:hypothetical protein
MPGAKPVIQTKVQAVENACMLKKRMRLEAKKAASGGQISFMCGEGC